MKAVFFSLLLVLSLNVRADFAYGTLVRTSLGEKAIQNFTPGDRVSIFSQAESTVTFSSGIPEQQSSGMIYLSYGDDFQSLIVSQDQLFVTVSGKLVRARDLIPGMELMGADRSPVPVLSVVMGHYSGGVHHIATGRDENPANHLLIVGGVVVGDFDLQIRYRGK